VSKFIWDEEDDVGVTVTPPESPVAALTEELAKVEAQLRAAGVTEEEEERLAAEPYGKEEK
jgi:hypothetical protein